MELTSEEWLKIRTFLQDYLQMCRLKAISMDLMSENEFSEIYVKKVNEIEGFLDSIS